MTIRSSRAGPSLDGFGPAPAGLNPLLVQARAASISYRVVESEVARLLRSANLSTARCLVLEALDRGPRTGLTLTELARFLGVHRTSAAAAVEHLARAGAVTRSIHSGDARKTQIELTDRGHQQLLHARQLLSQT